MNTQAYILKKLNKAIYCTTNKENFLQQQSFLCNFATQKGAIEETD